MCTREEVKLEIERALTENNKVRNLNLENNLQRQKEEIINHINKIVEDGKAIPTRKIDRIQSECVKRGLGIATMNEKISNMEKKIDGIIEKHEEHIEKLDAILERLDRKYAPKWVEKAMITVITLICTSVVIAWLAHIGLKN